MNTNPHNQGQAAGLPAQTWRLPAPVSHLDQRYRARKGTAMAAARSGTLKAFFRKGRGGLQAWVFQEDAEDWLRRGMPTEPGAEHAN